MTQNLLEQYRSLLEEYKDSDGLAEPIGQLFGVTQPGEVLRDEDG